MNKVRNCVDTLNRIACITFVTFSHIHFYNFDSQLRLRGVFVLPENWPLHSHVRRRLVPCLHYRKVGLGAEPRPCTGAETRGNAASPTYFHLLAELQSYLPTGDSRLPNLNTKSEASK